MRQLLPPQQMPRLAKTKQLDNPYQSTATASSEISRIFRLNDRNKVRLTEESDSQEQSVHEASGGLNRLATFDPQHRTEIEWEDAPDGLSPTKPIDNKLANESTGVRQSDRNSSGKAQASYTSPFTGKSDAPIATPQFNKIKLAESIPEPVAVNSKGGNINVLYRHHDHHEYSRQGQRERVTYIKQTYEYKESKKYLIGQDQPTPTKKISIHLPEEEDGEEVAEEDSLELQVHKGSMVIKSGSLHKPLLGQASRVISHGSQEEPNRGSIIDRIKEDSFIQSRVVQNNANSNNIQISKQQPSAGKKTMLHETTQTKPRRTRIFSGLTSGKKQPAQQVDEPSFVATPSPPQFSRKEEQSTYRQEEESRRTQNYAICPHTQCILKSLEIIDKLTDQPRPVPSLPVSSSTQAFRVKEEIESECLDLCMRVDRLMAELTLPLLLDEETGIRTRKLKYEVEGLIKKVKEKSEQGSSRGDNLHYRWELCQELQRMCKSLHYVQIVQERYKMWKVRLHHLGERIKDILRVDKAQQIKKLNDIAEHIGELEGARFYGTEAEEVGLVGAYNGFVEKEGQELRCTLEWLKRDILSV